MGIVLILPDQAMPFDGLQKISFDKKQYGIRSQPSWALGMPRPMGTPEAEKYQERSGQSRIVKPLF